jgi:hypothetical protein
MLDAQAARPADSHPGPSTPTDSPPGPSTELDGLLSALEERANTARTIFMLLDSDADGLVSVEQVRKTPGAGAPPCADGSAALPWPPGPGTRAAHPRATHPHA